MQNKKRQTSNFERFTDRPLYLFRFIGIDFEPKQRLFYRMQQWITVITIFVLMLHQVAYIVCIDGSSAERSATVSYINYYLVGLYKLLSIIYNRRKLAEFHQNLRRLGPTLQVEHSYKLQGYLKTYLRVESFLWNFFRYICLLYVIYPIAFSCYEWWHDGQYSYRLPLLFWFPVPLQQSLLEYFIYFALQSVCSSSIGVTILTCDLYLFSCISLVCLNFDLMAQQILQLQPLKRESSTQLKEIIKQHQHVLSLADEINQIFTPSIIFSLLSSSFIICFTAYQMLDDVCVIFFVKALVLLLYETKQVIITCYFGDKLIDTSTNLFDVIYLHNWYEGSMQYKRLVLFMMMRMREGTALTVAGIADVSLSTLKQVFRMSYQAFAVLKTA